MTFLTFLAETSLVRFVLFVAEMALFFRRTVLFPGHMAPLAWCPQMDAFQNKVRLLMVKDVLIKLNDIRIPALVFWMAVFAFRLQDGGNSAVEPFLQFDIRGHFFVAPDTETTL